LALRNTNIIDCYTFLFNTIFMNNDFGGISTLNPTQLSTLKNNLGNQVPFGASAVLQGQQQSAFNQFGNNLSQTQQNSVLSKINGISPTSRGGINFSSINSNNTTPVAGTAVGSDASNTYKTSNGGSATVGANGVVSTTAGNGYSIDTSGTHNSDHLGGNVTYGDIQSRHNTLQDYVDSLSQANGYSPGYIQAYQQQQGAQLQGAQLGLNSASINANLATGGGGISGLVGGQAQALTGQQQALNSLNQGVNQIQQLGANQALNTAQLARTGQIASAQAQLQYSPESTTQQNALSQYNNLQQQYPGANIPAIDPTKDLYQQLQNAHQTIASSPAYQAQYQQTYQTPGGGLGTYSKLNPMGGGNEIVSGSQASQASGYSTAIQDLTKQSANIGSSITVSDNNFPLLLQQMKSAGINDFSSPLANQIQQSVTAKLNGSLASFNAVRNSLEATYTAILSRGYAPTDSVRAEAQGLLNGTLGYKDMQSLYNTLKTESKNVLSGIETEKQKNINGLNRVQTSSGANTQPDSANSFTSPATGKSYFGWTG
jgi:hypothetical protein